MPAICKILLMSVLAVCTFMDVRSHTVSLPVILGGCIAAIVVNRAGDFKTFREMLIGLLPGVFLLIAALYFTVKDLRSYPSMKRSIEEMEARKNELIA